MVYRISILMMLASCSLKAFATGDVFLPPSIEEFEKFWEEGQPIDAARFAKRAVYEGKAYSALSRVAVYLSSWLAVVRVSHGESPAYSWILGYPSQNRFNNKSDFHAQMKRLSFKYYPTSLNEFNTIPRERYRAVGSNNLAATSAYRFYVDEHGNERFLQRMTCALDAGCTTFCWQTAYKEQHGFFGRVTGHTPYNTLITYKIPKGKVVAYGVFSVESGYEVEEEDAPRPSLPRPTPALSVVD